jgi:hypothetical protein
MLCSRGRGRGSLGSGRGEAWLIRSDELRRAGHPRGRAGFRRSSEACASARTYGRRMHSTTHFDTTSLAVRTEGLGKRFGTRAALIRLLLGLAEPTAGRMHVLGRELPGGRAAALARVGVKGANIRVAGQAASR